MQIISCTRSYKKRKEHIEYPRKNFEILLENRMEEIKHY